MPSSILDRCWSCVCSTPLFPIGLSPFCDLSLGGYETSLRQFHSRLLPDCRLSYSLASLELDKGVVCGQGEPEDGSGSHEENFEGQCLFTEERRVDMAQGRGSSTKRCPLGSTLLRTNVEKQEGTRRSETPQRKSALRDTPRRTDLWTAYQKAGLRLNPVSFVCIFPALAVYSRHVVSR